MIKKTARYYQNVIPNFKSTERNELILVSPSHKQDKPHKDVGRSDGQFFEPPASFSSDSEETFSIDPLCYYFCAKA